MALAELTDPIAVSRAMDEFDRIGRDAFLRKYGFGRSRNYFVERDGNLYDSKAIAGVAHGIEHPDRGPLRHEEFSGGDATVRRKLEELGFVVRARDVESSESLSDIMARVLELQRSYSSSNTPEMQLRGRLVREDGRRAVQNLLLAPPSLSFEPEVEGRDGTGLKTRVPWIRVYDKRRSPRATSGWYIAYLFAADGSAVYLSLGQGTTTFEGGDFRSRPPAYLQQQAEMARSLVTSRRDDRLLQEMTLHDPGGLGQGYEQGNVFAYRYDNGAIPDDEGLQTDLRTMLEMLDAIYVGDEETTDSFAAVLRRVLELQGSWSSNGNTPEMQLRGRLLKQEGPRALQLFLADIPGLPFVPEVEGGDGTSRKTRVPWILVFDRQHYRRPSLRWYVAYLFSADGSSVYLSLSLGSLRQEDGRNRSLPSALREACVQWARSLLELGGIERASDEMALHDPTGLGPFWEQGSAIAYRYGSHDIPDDEQLKVDLGEMLEMLEVIYENQHLAPTPPGDGGPRIEAWDALRLETLWTDDDLTEVVEALRGTGLQIVLAGPPGTGKTRVARAIARYLTEDEPSRWRIVQFHPSYGYEEFVEGLRPGSQSGAPVFEVRPGVVKSMVEAIDTDDRPYVLVIDEMNRANLPRVFGELMYLLEYRDEPVDLQYSRNFRLPRNLLFIGTMNTADRSIRSIDIALRRRFEIFECPPDVRVLERYYESVGTNYVPDLLSGLERLNEELAGLLDKHHTIGHTYLMAKEMTAKRIRWVWKRQIGPLIEEYFFDQPDVGSTFVPERFWQQT